MRVTRGTRAQNQILASRNATYALARREKANYTVEYPFYRHNIDTRVRVHDYPS